MCTNGVNTDQFAKLIEQLKDHVKVEKKWAHDLAHMAEDAGFPTADEKLHAAMAMLNSAKDLLEDALDALEDDAEAASGAAITVELV